MSHYSTKKELEHAAGVDTTNLVAKNDFIALKVEGERLEINKLVIVLTSLNNLKTKVGQLNVGELKTVPVDLKNWVM